MNFNFSSLGLHNASLLPMSMLDAVASIDWLKEPYLLLLLILHALIFLLILIKRNQLNFLIPILFILLFICACASWINELAATYSSYIVSDQYFDSYGLFISLIWSFPALLNCFVITALLLYHVTELLVQKKRLEWGVEKRADAQKKKQ